MSRVDDVDLLDTKSIHVSNDRSNVSRVLRLLDDGNQVFASKILDLVSPPPR